MDRIASGNAFLRKALENAAHPPKEERWTDYAAWAGESSSTVSVTYVITGIVQTTPKVDTVKVAGGKMRLTETETPMIVEEL